MSRPHHLGFISPSIWAAASISCQFCRVHCSVITISYEHGTSPVWVGLLDWHPESLADRCWPKVRWMKIARTLRDSRLVGFGNQRHVEWSSRMGALLAFHISPLLPRKVQLTFLLWLRFSIAKYDSYNYLYLCILHLPQQCLLRQMSLFVWLLNAILIKRTACFDARWNRSFSVDIISSLPLASIKSQTYWSLSIKLTPW